MAAAVAAGPDVHFAAGVGHFEGAENGFAVFFGGEIIVEGSAVDLDFSGAGRDANAGDGGLAATDAPGVGRLCFWGFRFGRLGEDGSTGWGFSIVSVGWELGSESWAMIMFHFRLARQLQLLGLLRGVGMFVALVDLNLGKNIPAHLALGQHSPNRQLQELLRMEFLHGFE